ncbi:MAG: DUF4964 domain-containing protein [Caldilineaceae bacterium]
MTNQRVPAYPLVVNDPYLSVWSTHDRLTNGWSSHWTGTEQGRRGLIRMLYDNNLHRKWLGKHLETES